MCRLRRLFAAVTIIVSVFLAGCGTDQNGDEDRIRIVATIFPEYD